MSASLKLWLHAVYTITQQHKYTYACLCMKMSQNINETTRHLKFRYISILTNLLRTRKNRLLRTSTDCKNRNITKF